MNSRTLALAAVAAAVLSATPAGAAPEQPAKRMSVCQVKAIGEHSEIGQIVVIAGYYKGPATAVDIKLTCGVVVNGGTVARVTDRLTGPVAALADVQGVRRGPVSSCYEILVTDLNGNTSYSDTCP